MRARGARATTAATWCKSRRLSDESPRGSGRVLPAAEPPFRRKERGVGPSPRAGPHLQTRCDQAALRECAALGAGVSGARVLRALGPPGGSNYASWKRARAIAGACSGWG
eukprot:201612-Alexandrium_andersonii.AAC.1